MWPRRDARPVVPLRAYLIAALLLATTLAVASPAAAIQCAEPQGDSLVTQLARQAGETCNGVIYAVYHGDIVRDLLNVIDDRCVFVTGSPCIP
jgi:hypothetical protein